MAYLRKIRKAYQIQYYVDGQRNFKYFHKGTPKSVVKAAKQRIESDVAMHKAGVKRFAGEESRGVGFVSLGELTEKVMAIRKNEVSKETFDRNSYAMRIFMMTIGSKMEVSKIQPQHIDQFKVARFEYQVKEYQRKKWQYDQDRIRRGINKDLVNIRTIFNAAAKKGIIPKSMVPKFEMFRVSERLPSVLDDNEIILMANHLEGDALLAFWIIRYTGARRGEIAKRYSGDDRGLKWKDIDWMNNRLRLYGKSKEKYVPIHSRLREILLERFNLLGPNLDANAHIIKFRGDTLSACFRRAIKKAGINKPGAIHILRHSAATALLKTGSIREVQEFLGHSKLTTTQIYTHIVQENLENAVERAFK